MKRWREFYNQHLAEEGLIIGVLCTCTSWSLRTLLPWYVQLHSPFA